MADYLIFTLYSPLSSWGDIAVGEVRGSKTHPGRSAIFGLIAASLGIRRNESDAIGNLHDSLGLGIKVVTSGHLMKDFHTIQAARSQKSSVYRRRADELNADQDLIGTLISTREYRSDAFYIAAIWDKSGQCKYSLNEIKDALKSPVFVPYLGRKSCPPACNFAPEIIGEKQTLKDAFDEYKIKPVWQYYDNEEWNLNYMNKAFRNKTEIYYWDDCDNSGLNGMLTTQRYDTVKNAARRQFSPRRENMALINKGEE